MRFARSCAWQLYKVVCGRGEQPPGAAGPSSKTITFGSAVGLAVVGSLVGSVVGLAVGSVVGLAVGSVVGFAVGSAVTMAAGAAPPPQAQQAALPVSPSDPGESP